MKIIKNDFYITGKAWDITGGKFGSNQWKSSDLKTELNGSSFYKNTGYIDEINRSYIANATWYTGGTSNPTLADFEDAERSSSSTGYIGLISMTDFGYASNNTNCERTIDLNSRSNVCTSNNYLLNNIYQWTITPRTSDNFLVWRVPAGDYVNNYYAYNSYGVRPSFFLKPEVKIIDGIGTKTKPSRLSM